RFRLVQELRDSRARIVAAQDVERRRIERNLHDGAQQRFVNALLALGMAEADLGGGKSRAELVDDATREVRAGLSELRGLVRGLEPPLLAEAGIVAAVSALADRAPIPTSVAAGALPRYSAGIETAAYFVVAEVLTNAAKHSGADQIKVAIREEDEWLRIEVSDDGRGGADPARGSGITGLRDRVAALGGRIAMTSPPGGGTVVRAELPCR
ncbi:MAG TPA: ATP-binding protein, partial [Methylomirabilota bacterium]|nr:ATP-binding protein [Methylomirabilota bacterium]